MENLKTDLEQDEVFVFTPEGPGRSRCRSARRRSTSPTRCTPRSATRCIGAKVNGRLVPLDHKLRSGDTCEIFTSKVESAGAVARLAAVRRVAAGPQQDPQWFCRERRVDAIETGRDELTKEFRREGAADAADVDQRRARRARSRRLGYADLDAAARGHRRAPRVGPLGRAEGRPRRSAPATTTSSCRPRVLNRRGAARGSATPPASTSRASTTCWCACRGAARRCPATRSSASSPAVAASACTAPTAPTPRA